MVKHIVDAGRPKLVAIRTMHVDDLKLAGSYVKSLQYFNRLNNVCGKL
jgi:hypothetical protein